VNAKLVSDPTATMPADDQQATQVVVRNLMRLEGHQGNTLKLDERVQAKETFALVVAVRMSERRLERTTIDRALLGVPDWPRTGDEAYTNLLREQHQQTVRLINDLRSIADCWVHRPDGMYVRLPGYAGQINALHKQLMHLEQHVIDLLDKAPEVPT